MSKISDLIKELCPNGVEYKPIKEIQAYVNAQLNTFWDSYKKLSKPKKYKVDLSQNLWDLKSELLASKIVF